MVEKGLFVSYLASCFEIICLDPKHDGNQNIMGWSPVLKLLNKK
jgi:hypothetical protein